MEDSFYRRIQDLRLICEREIPIPQQRASSKLSSFRKSLQSIKHNVAQTVQDQQKLGQIKARLRELEDELVKALSVKTRKEAKRMAIGDSISAAGVRTEELKNVVHEETIRKEKYEAIVSRQRLDLKIFEEKAKEETKDKEGCENAIAWYNNVLGIRIEAGHGVKFIFNKIDMNDPHKEYSFSIRHGNDTYTLLDCDPYLDDIKELIKELNRTNGLFKFVRIVRDKFQAAASIGSNLATSVYPDSTTISTSAPAPSVSIDRSESPSEQNLSEGQSVAFNRNHKKYKFGGVAKSTILSPQSESSVRRSSRLKVKK